jgi:tetratricopeptide (TPR) repeat protein
LDVAGPTEWYDDLLIRFPSGRSSLPIMRRFGSEYLLKGVFLGLLFYSALQVSDWPTLLRMDACLAAGLVLALVVSGGQKFREGYRIHGRPAAFLLFLLLESDLLIFAGIVLGLFLGTQMLPEEAADRQLFIWCLLGGALLGVVFGFLNQVRRPPVRLGLSVGLAMVLAVGALFWFGQFAALLGGLEWASPIHNKTFFGAQLLLGMPFFYLLTFAGREEESEMEIGILCAALGLGWAMLGAGGAAVQIVGYLCPVLIFFWYTTFVLGRLRVFKHSLRGLSFARLGRNRLAILAFRRALRLDPNNELAREGLWSLHKKLDAAELAADPQTLALVDFELCLERVASLLLAPNPSPEKLDEARKLLDLTASQKPALLARIRYWRSVLATHARDLDAAVTELEALLRPENAVVNDPERRKVLYFAWRLALGSHPELTRRVGTPEITKPGGRMAAIAAVEDRLAQDPTDPDGWSFKQLLYQAVTKEEYDVIAGQEHAAAHFDHAYALQLGQALISDRNQWRRGVEYLGLAARGLPQSSPSIYMIMAQTCQREGDVEFAHHYVERAKHAGRTLGPGRLGPEDRQAYFTAVKTLAEEALAKDLAAQAVENLQLYSEYERSGLETVRTLANLYERLGDPLSALRATEKGLLYNATDKDLLEKKDRYYYSLMPEDLQARKDLAAHGFDIEYCLNKARKLLDAKHGDLETVEWATHLIELARVLRPDLIVGKVLHARACLRKGERDQAVELLESVRTPRPENFATGADEEAWYMSNRLLGDLYLGELGRADLALECFTSYRQSSKSGADTLYKLGQAYEQLGDRARATKFYKHVVSYEGHPLAPEARDALYRLETASS